MHVNLMYVKRFSKEGHQETYLAYSHFKLLSHTYGPNFFASHVQLNLMPHNVSDRHLKLQQFKTRNYYAACTHTLHS